MNIDYEDDDDRDDDDRDDDDRDDDGQDDLEMGSSSDPDPLRLPDEGSYVCNSCGESIVVPIDCTQGHRQQYVEDCPVCCCPNLIFVDVDDQGGIQVSSQPE